MKTTNLGNVAVQDIGVKRSSLPINRNVFTSCGFGEVQPIQFLQVDADTETTFSVEDLTFVEALAAPVYGHCSVKYWHYFVAMRDLFKDFDALLAQTKVRKVGGLFVPHNVPYAPRNLISTMLLWGAKCTVYQYKVNSNGDKEYYAYRPTGATYNMATYTTALMTAMSTIATQYKPSYMNAALRLIPSAGSNANPTGVVSDYVETLGMRTAWFDARLLVDFDDDWAQDYRYEDGQMKIPLANYSYASFMDLSGMSDWSYYHGLDPNTVVVGKHDYLIERPLKNESDEPLAEGLAFVFRLSAFGRRLLKVFKGVEFQESFTDSTPVSLMPFFAVYKAYFDCFGLLAYDNFESTAAKRLLNHYEQWCGHRLGPDFSVGFYSNGVPNNEGNAWIPNNVFQDFIKDLGSLWITDSQDIASAHVESPAYTQGDDQSRSDTMRYLQHGFAQAGEAEQDVIQVSNQHQDDIAGREDPATLSNHAYIQTLIHSHLNSELLKTIYLTTNLQTIAGQRAKEALIMLGFGDWVEHQTPRFIGYDEQSIEFNQVQAKADTLKDGTGMALGERAGVGESYKYNKTHKFTNNELGFVISLMAVCPDSGYVNTMNVAFSCVNKWDFFQPAYDGVGMELNTVGKVIAGAELNAVSDPTLNKPLSITKESFGYAPTATKFKFVNNIFNGKFAQQSVMDNYTPYSLDRVIKLGEIAQLKNENVTVDDYKMMKITTALVFDPMKTPRAGLVWRYPTRYPWLGQLTRIFAAIGDFVNDGDTIGQLNMLMNGYEYYNLEADGFVMLQTIRGQEWTHKLPITDSFETREDGNSGPISTNVSKA